MSVRVYSTLSRNIPVSNGVQKGNMLGHLIFLISLNDIASTYNKGDLMPSFADDTEIGCVPKERDLIQDILNAITDYCNDVQLVMNPDKCEVLHNDTNILKMSIWLMALVYALMKK